MFYFTNMGLQELRGKRIERESRFVLKQIHFVILAQIEFLTALVSPLK